MRTLTEKHFGLFVTKYILVWLTLCSTTLSAETPLRSYSKSSFTPEERCTDLQRGIESWLAVAESERCGTNLSHWKLWRDPTASKAWYNWCVQQSTEAVSELRAQAYHDFFRDSRVGQPEKVHDQSVLCLPSRRDYYLDEEYSIKWYPLQAVGRAEYKENKRLFQRVPEALRDFIIQAEKTSHFRLNNPLRRLYPERPGCHLKGDQAQLSRATHLKHWIVYPTEACWDWKYYSDNKEQYWAQRFWIVEEHPDHGYRLLLEDNANTKLIVEPSWTDGYYDLIVITNYWFTLSAGKRFDPLSQAEFDEMLRTTERYGGYVYQRFHYDAKHQQYRQPDKGTWFF